jgi:hypothetical protein
MFVVKRLKRLLTNTSMFCMQVMIPRMSEVYFHSTKRLIVRSIASRFMHRKATSMSESRGT